jgi:hypothetical protein
MTRVLRTCPNCNNKSVDIGELSSGSTCLSCRKTIEVNHFYSYSVPIFLCTMALLFFKFSLTILGIISLGGLLFYNSSHEHLTTRYFPLKNYE